jgi:hypothetical protein
MRFNVVINEGKDSKDHQYKVIMDVGGHLHTFTCGKDVTIQSVVLKYQEELFKYETVVESTLDDLKDKEVPK